MDDINKIYYQTVKSMGVFARTIVNSCFDRAEIEAGALTDEGVTVQLQETEEYDSRIEILDSSNNFAKLQLKKLVDIFNDTVNNLLYIDKFNSVTNILNSYTAQVKEIKLFIDEDFIGHVLNQWERTVVKESISEYELKVKTVYDLLYRYKNNPENINRKTVKLPNGKVVEHNVNKLLLPKL